MAPDAAQAFEEALKVTAAAVDRQLGLLLPDRAGDRLHAAMRYAALSQGKRLRPFLVMQSAALCDGSQSSALRVGAALECVHCYSLVHDDLPAMDDDDLRRGQPTTHKKFDEATAILAGDGLLTFAFEILADAATHADGAIRSALVLALAKAAGEAGMVGGQMRDITAETMGFATYDEIAAMQAMKTGALFRFACEAGAIMAASNSGPLRQYADHFGLAFQLTDDILDVESTPERAGKATGKDKSKGKATFVDLLGLDGAKREAQHLTHRAIAALDSYGPKADHLRAAARFVTSRQK